MATAIMTEHLTKRFGEATAVSDLDLEVEVGEIYGFIGPNGAGKTTAIRLLLDLLRPTEGRAEVFGLDTHTDAAEIHQRLGYLPSQLGLVQRQTAAGFLSWFARVRQIRATNTVHELAERLDLDLTRRIGELSTGNKQKVGLVQALMHQPDLLILDEPTSGLDPLIQQEVRCILQETRDRGATVFLSSHVLSEVESVCDRVGIIVGGELRRTDSIATPQTTPARQVRLVLVDAARNVDIRALSSVDDVRTLHDPSAGTTTVEFTLRDGPGELLEWLRGRTVVDLLSTPVTLEDRFLDAFSAAAQREIHHVA